MKYIVSEQELEIPEGVTVDVKSRTVTVKGKLGTLTKSFRHIPFEMVKEKNKKGSPALKFRMWLQKKKRNAVLGTVRSTIRNMINGVTNGYKFKMVLAYSHFPIVVNIIENGRVIVYLIFSQLKSRTFWVSRWTRESMPQKEFWSPKKKKRRTTLLFNQLIWKKFLKFAPESSKQLSFKIRISDLSWTVFTFKMPDFNTPIDSYTYLNSFRSSFLL